MRQETRRSNVAFDLSVKVATPRALLKRLFPVEWSSVNDLEILFATRKFKSYKENNPLYDYDHTEDSLFFGVARQDFLRKWDNEIEKNLRNISIKLRETEGGKRGLFHLRFSAFRESSPAHESHPAAP